jgi:signal transduction histidine kinase
VCVQFKDSGHGLDEKQVLTSTGLLQSKKPQGTGLGLMVVKKIVESHCGIIRIDSKKQQGTTIQIRIPVRPALEKQGG